MTEEIRTIRAKTANEYSLRKMMEKLDVSESDVYTYKGTYTQTSYVTCKTNEDVKNALRHKDRKLVDEWLDPSFFKNDLRGKWPIIEPLNEIDYISSINADCLLHICSFLKQNDLLNLAKVSQKFEDIVKAAITKVVMEFRYEREDLTDIFQKFGYFISNLKIGYTSSSHCFELILQYCSNDNLKFVEFLPVDFFSFPIDDYRRTKVFLNLQTLKFPKPVSAWSYDNTIHQIIGLCPSLKKLKFDLGEPFDNCHYGMYAHFIPINIERITLAKSVKPEFINNVIQRCEGLKHLTCFIEDSTRIANIVKYQPNLLKLKCQVGNFPVDDNIRQIENLKSLKTFEIGHNVLSRQIDLIRAISEIDSLEKLTIRGFRDMSIILPLISKMKNLRILRTPSSCIKLDEWKQFTLSLHKIPLLEYLSFGLDFFPNDEILVLIQQLPKLKMLDIASGPLKHPLSLNILKEIIEHRTKNQIEPGTKCPLILSVKNVSVDVHHFFTVSDKYDSIVRLNYDKIVL